MTMTQDATPGERRAAGSAPLLPLNLVRGHASVTVQRLTGDPDTRRYLGSLGFVEGTRITLIAGVAGNVIVDVKGSRVAIDASLARRVMTA